MRPCLQLWIYNRQRMSSSITNAIHLGMRSQVSHQEMHLTIWGHPNWKTDPQVCACMDLTTPHKVHDLTIYWGEDVLYTSMGRKMNSLRVVSHYGHWSHYSRNQDCPADPRQWTESPEVWVLEGRLHAILTSWGGHEIGKSSLNGAKLILMSKACWCLLTGYLPKAALKTPNSSPLPSLDTCKRNETWQTVGSSQSQRYPAIQADVRWRTPQGSSLLGWHWALGGEDCSFASVLLDLSLWLSAPSHAHGMWPRIRPYKPIIAMSYVDHLQHQQQQNPNFWNFKVRIQLAAGAHISPQALCIAARLSFAGLLENFPGWW